MKFKKVLSCLELEGQGRGIIMEVTRPLLLGPFYKSTSSVPLYLSDLLDFLDMFLDLLNLFYFLDLVAV